MNIRFDSHLEIQWRKKHCDATQAEMLHSSQPKTQSHTAHSDLFTTELYGVIV